MSSPTKGGVFDENGNSKGKATLPKDADQIASRNKDRVIDADGTAIRRMSGRGTTAVFSLSFERLPQFCWMLLEMLTTQAQAAQDNRSLEHWPFWGIPNPIARQRSEPSLTFDITFDMLRAAGAALRHARHTVDRLPKHRRINQTRSPSCEGRSVSRRFDRFL
jgi:hypothetical protein